MIYLTFGDQYSGIFQSQVIDVCQFYEEELKTPVRLISFVPYVTYKKNRQLIKSNYKKTIVLPMVPSRNHWYFLYMPFLFISILFSFFSKETMMTRSIWMANMLIKLKKLGGKYRIVYDGRGAAKAEWEEYLNLDNYDPQIIEQAEKNAVILSDWRVAVSNKLVDYWRNEYGYNKEGHCVIPCTINKDFQIPVDKRNIEILNKQVGIDLTKIIITFSGGTDKWQSFDKIITFANDVLSLNKEFFFLFLTKENSLIDSLKIKFPKNVMQKWVKPNEVKKYLSLSDYGVLLRENTVTNQVASPTKLAEYLAMGLIPIISDNIGDYSETLLTNNMAIHYVAFLKNIEKHTKKIATLEKQKYINYAHKHYIKETYKSSYARVNSY